MALELRQELRLTQQLIMTPQLQMAIKLLQLNRLELMDMIQHELEVNPTLEEFQDVSAEDPSDQPVETPPDDTDKLSTKEVKIEEKILDNIDWSNYIEEYNSPGRISFETEGKDSPKFETFISRRPSLTDHLLWQLVMMIQTPEEEKIGCLIIGNLNKDGYLDISIEDLAEASNSTPEKVEAFLSRMQTFDPIGICARDIRECLLIQANHFNLDNSIVTDIVQNHLKHLENKNYRAISRALKVSIESVISAVKVIKGLEPRPGRQFSDEEPQYITPDIYVHEFDNDFTIMLNDDGLPKLRMNAFYKNAISRNKEVSAKARDYIQDKLRSAAWLIRSIHQRQKTIFKVMESIVKFQREFFEKGVEHLKPMVLRDVAQDINMHESTISRVTTNKYTYTPQGIFELKYFFNSSIKRIHGGVIASTSVQGKIKQIIESENPKKPYSDSKIAEFLKKENINIARRTVAKYRDILKVLPSNKRKQF
ncbi:MAG: RNA polymerase factor sigma-54 [Deltaproteobacteria bacterium]|nr:RNA polymerase factor sigma-54 [Deltaproteobacteria bacterium]